MKPRKSSGVSSTSLIGLAIVLLWVLISVCFPSAESAATCIPSPNCTDCTCVGIVGPKVSSDYI
ncbi:hypothetical protein AHF37_11351 [Paragonimus kellicotti]|nr:hypothetical protein AHF37_11351 [Paragonimus kellicotti]